MTQTKPKAYQLTRAEQETILRFAADESKITISTSNPVIVRKLDRLTDAAPEVYKRLHPLTDTHDARYEMPVKLLRFGKPASEAQREAARLKAAHLNSKP